MHGKRGVVMSAIYFTIATWGCGCVTKVYPDERLAIDPVFLRLFNSLHGKDTIRFNNSSGREQVFVIGKVDSIVMNEKGWFINGAPYKILRFGIREIGRDTSLLERENTIFVNKDPLANRSTFSIEFNNFLYHVDDTLPPLNTDTIVVAGKKISNYYFFKTDIRQKGVADVKEMFLSLGTGLVAYKTLNGDEWSKKDY